MEIHRPKQEWREAKVCISTNITSGQIPVISRGLSRVGPGKISLQSLITQAPVSQQLVYWAVPENKLQLVKITSNQSLGEKK